MGSTHLFGGGPKARKNEAHPPEVRGLRKILGFFKIMGMVKEGLRFFENWNFPKNFGHLF